VNVAVKTTSTHSILFGKLKTATILHTPFDCRAVLGQSSEHCLAGSRGLDWPHNLTVEVLTTVQTKEVDATNNYETGHDKLQSAKKERKQNHNQTRHKHV
jgi:hypothetical protein